MKTLAIRLDDDLHARLTIVAKLAEVSLTDAIRQAIESHVQTMSAKPDIQAKADALRQDIEREAADNKEPSPNCSAPHPPSPPPASSTHSRTPESGPVWTDTPNPTGEMRSSSTRLLPHLAYKQRSQLVFREE